MALRPKILKSSYRRHMANREIMATLRKLTAAGSRVRYETADIRDAR